MVGQTRRAAIRKQYRLLRLAAEKTQLEVEALARLDAGKFWKIENGLVFPTPEERERLARVLKVPETDLPSADREPAVAQ
jgi:transcriptional regulator with XRE-family HTH domain